MIHDRGPRIGKVVHSSSHIIYSVQIDDPLSSLYPPQPEDYAFGNFVKIEDDQTPWCVGVIFNSALHNPGYNSFGPRLTAEPDPMFSPDLISETSVIVSVCGIGRTTYHERGSSSEQSVPVMVVPVNTPVIKMVDEEIEAFHRNDGAFMLHYMSTLMQFCHPFSTQVCETVINKLINMNCFEEAEVKAMHVLAKNMAWTSMSQLLGR